MLKEPATVKHINTQAFAQRLSRRTLTRRDVLWLAGASSVATGLGLLNGCATDPVTGKQTLNLLSKRWEINLDQTRSPHQFSRDYGAVQDATLNAYLDNLGSRIAGRSHRPDMPYSVRAVNANYINAYAFPGGSIATTRGILLEIEDEAELGALLGHEIGHVNARHAGERMTRGLLAQAAILGSQAALSSDRYADYRNIVGQLGIIGGSALLSSYSRDNEREADALGMDYAARSEINPHGMVGLMEILVAQSERKPSAIEAMFSTHPMSAERLAAAQRRAADRYPSWTDAPRHRERYMDNTVTVRRIAKAIELEQQAEADLSRKSITDAERHVTDALKVAPDDYVGTVLMAKIKLAQDRPREAKAWADKAVQIYPQEAQGHHLGGVSRLGLKDYAGALNSLSNYDRRLAGDPATAFLIGVAHEGLGQPRRAARQYRQYLASAPSGAQAQYAVTRLTEWGAL